MNILQISAPKSGSYWLHTILLQILQKKNIALRSFIKEQQVYQEAKNLELSFKGQAGVDMIDIEEDACYYRISSVFREKIKDPKAYAKSTALAWTHSTLCTKSFEVFPFFDKKICIVRDPRDRALSSAKFAFTPYMQKHYPSSYPSSEEYFEKEYRNLLDKWVWFTGNYLLHKQELNIHFVFYENLLHDFTSELKKLLNYLGLTLTEKEQQEIAEAVTFSNMKEKSPAHLHKGKSRKWEKQLNEDEKFLAVDRAGALMEWLSYPHKGSDPDTLPRMPDKIPTADLERLLQNMNWYELYNS
ncbi:sulfotransferase domain-containing protein [Salinimicrobium sp. GXAS 041]|uniref:sulfotransferase domain-containing protein n=1 Tax=Salinimicrobium sp. GXAS 041 TaxID=3400806 RepID=UPI003C73DC90